MPPRALAEAYNATALVFTGGHGCRPQRAKRDTARDGGADADSIRALHGRDVTWLLLDMSAGDAASVLAALITEGIGSCSAAERAAGPERLTLGELRSLPSSASGRHHDACRKGQPRHIAPHHFAALIVAVLVIGADRIFHGYLGESDEAIGYAIGGKLVGKPWEVKLPTDLVNLDASMAFT